MKTLFEITIRLRRKFALTPEQADLIATIKFPCC